MWSPKPDHPLRRLFARTLDHLARELASPSMAVDSAQAGRVGV